MIRGGVTAKDQPMGIGDKAFAKVLREGRVPGNHGGVFVLLPPTSYRPICCHELNWGLHPAKKEYEAIYKK